MRSLLIFLTAMALTVGCSDSSSGSGGMAEDPVLPQTGQGAEDYLTDSPFSRLVIEVDVAEGQNLDPAALSLLVQRAGERCNKPGGIDTDTAQVIPSADLQSAWSASDLLDLRARFFDQVSGGDTAGLYVLYLNGRWADNPDVLGVTFAADAYAIFPERIQAAFPVPLARERVERAVHVHEFGHLLGLVGLSIPHAGHSPAEHQDANDPVHDENDQCVMFREVGGGLLSDPPNDFCGCCQVDVEAAGGRPATVTTCP